MSFRADIRRLRTWMWLLPALAGLTPSASAMAQDTPAPQTVTLHVWEQKLRLEADLSGDHGRLIRYLRDNIPGLEVSVSNAARGRQQLASDPNSCVFPLVIDATGYFLPDLSRNDYVESVPIDRILGHVFSRKDEPVVSSLTDLAGKTVGVHKDVLTVPLWGEDAEASMEIIRAPTSEHNIRLLARGRVDHIAGWFPDTAQLMNHLENSDYHFDPAFRLMDVTSHIVCRTSLAGRAVMAQINQRILDLQRSGRMRLLLPDPALPVEAGVPAMLVYPQTGVSVIRNIDPLAGTGER